MKHEHFQEINSTQDYLLERNPRDEYLVSCDTQTDGRGRYGRKWENTEGSLCFSFTLRAGAVMTHAPLEVAVLINQYFENRLRVKWPNDLFDKSLKKCGGILIDTKGSTLTVGVGLNLSASSDYGHILEEAEFKNIEKKHLAGKIYQYILDNRLHGDKVIELWERYCIHMNQEVTIDETKGNFIGLGPEGEAMLNVQGDHTKSFFTGSLSFKA
ncbi:MAG: biotin--[acetyl-CoA-carboxylase] ligase [Halobacteriovoraceae bacterium]|nr:biotin--[acetyl-CoA-carboxylase] ligase [Halobacteriovoraceae bacterium]|tara:strand:+ start:4025 stop:4663 length:639 start_codon:yes stop_codon:yes gene_type:complete